jgi:glycerophosphoryl diester phosphodiesterase
MSMFTIVAKAGGSDEGAENTCEAIAAALAAKPPSWVRLGIEVDVRMSADGVLVALHDADLERTTTGRGIVRSKTFDALRTLHAGPRGERIPRLEEIFEIVGDHALVLELHDDSPAAAEALARACVARQTTRVIVASEHVASIRRVRATAPTIPTAATAHEAWQKVLLERVRLERWSPRGHMWMVPERHRGLHVATPRFVRSASQVGDDVWVYVVNDAAEVLRLRELGVTGCFTTVPRGVCERLTSRDTPESQAIAKA